MLGASRWHRQGQPLGGVSGCASCPPLGVRAPGVVPKAGTGLLWGRARTTHSPIHPPKSASKAALLSVPALWERSRQPRVCMCVGGYVHGWVTESLSPAAMSPSASVARCSWHLRGVDEGLLL